MAQLCLSKNAINEAIMAFEVSWTKETGFATYTKKYAKPVVPDSVNTESGVTIGLGYDCGQYSAAKIIRDWTSILPMNMVIALSKTSGLKKQSAVQALPSVSFVNVPIEAALQVFYNNTIFDSAKQAFRIYPDLPNLHPVEQSVIVGLVYNRGAGLDGDRRKEMRQLVTDIKLNSDQNIANDILAMCRLWPSTEGLLRRRRKEAALILMPDLPLDESDKLYITV